MKKPKILDINKYKFDIDVDNNLTKIYKEFGQYFNLKILEFIIPIKLIKVKLASNGLEFWRLEYDTPDDWPHALRPLAINFVPLYAPLTKNHSYIQHLHKTDNISGTDLMKIALEINRLLGVKKTGITDAVKIVCTTDIGKEDYLLSLPRLLEKGYTFYTKLGFEFDISAVDKCYFIFKTKTEKQKYINDIIKQCKSIKSKDVQNLLNNIDNILSKNKCKVYSNNVVQPQNILPSKDFNISYYVSPQLQITSLANDIKILLNNIDWKKYDKFYKVIYTIFNDSKQCKYYKSIYNIITTNICLIKNNKLSIKIDIFESFKILNKLIEITMMTYTFK